MKASDYIGGNTITVDYVKSSKTKQLVILSAGSEKVLDGKRKLEFLTEMEGKQKTWTVNATTLRNLIDALGDDTQLWVGKVVRLDVEMINGREAVIGRHLPQTSPMD